MDTRCRSSGVPDGGPTVADAVGRAGSSGRAVARQIPGRQPSSDEDSGGGPTWVSSWSPPRRAAPGLGTQKSWRRPIFPKGCPLSIFGAGELDFRVRDGNGYGLSASVTRIRCVWMLFGRDRHGPEGRRGRRAAVDLRKSESRRGSIHDVPATDPRSVAVEVKPSTVSTAQLHPSPNFHRS